MTKAWVKLPYVRASATARADPDSDVALLARLSTLGVPGVASRERR
jgi:hypothetical protein